MTIISSNKTFHTFSFKFIYLACPLHPSFWLNWKPIAVLRKWRCVCSDSGNPKGGELMQLWVDMLFVNEKVTPVTLLSTDSLWLFLFINSHRLNNSIKLSNSPLAIRCVWSVEGISYSNNWWTVQVLQLWPQLLALANTNTHLRGLFLDFYLTRLTLTYPISESCQLNLPQTLLESWPSPGALLMTTFKATSAQWQNHRWKGNFHASEMRIGAAFYH